MVGISTLEHRDLWDPMGGRAMICPVGQLKTLRRFPLWRPNSWIFTSVYRLFCLSGNQTWQFYAMFDYRRVSIYECFFFWNPLWSLLRRVGYQLVCAASDHGLLAEGAGIGQFASSESLIMKCVQDFSIFDETKSYPCYTGVVFCRVSSGLAM